MAVDKKNLVHDDVAAEDPPDRPLDLPERGPDIGRAPLPERVRVDQDTLIERRDLGLDAQTFVAAGDLIPVGLEQYPREPA
jgi:hypothetical protein